MTTLSDDAYLIENLNRCILITIKGGKMNQNLANDLIGRSAINCCILVIPTQFSLIFVLAHNISST